MADTTICALIRNVIGRMEPSGDGRVLAATIMTDHIHLLLELGSRLTVSQVVGKTKAAIKRASPVVHWQRNFFEHRLRDLAAAEDFAFYIFMNPYVAGFCSLDKTWPGWIPSTVVRWQFSEMLGPDGLPLPEWLDRAKHFARTLPPGAD